MREYIRFVTDSRTANANTGSNVDWIHPVAKYSLQNDFVNCIWCIYKMGSEPFFEHIHLCCSNFSGTRLSVHLTSGHSREHFSFREAIWCSEVYEYSLMPRYEHTDYFSGKV